MEQRQRLDNFNAQFASLRFAAAHLGALAVDAEAATDEKAAATKQPQSVPAPVQLALLVSPTHWLKWLAEQAAMFDEMVAYAVQKQLLLSAVERVGAEESATAMVLHTPFQAAWRECAELAASGKQTLDTAVAVAEAASTKLGCAVLATAACRRALERSAATAATIVEAIRPFCAVDQRNSVEEGAEEPDVDREKGGASELGWNCLRLREASGRMLALSSRAATILHADNQSTDGGASPSPDRTSDAMSVDADAGDAGESQDGFAESFGNAYEILVEQALLSTQALRKLSAAWQTEATELREDEYRQLIGARLAPVLCWSSFLRILFVLSLRCLSVCRPVAVHRQTVQTPIAALGRVGLGGIAGQTMRSLLLARCHERPSCRRDIGKNGGAAACLQVVR